MNAMACKAVIARKLTTLGSRNTNPAKLVANPAQIINIIVLM